MEEKLGSVCFMVFTAKGFAQLIIISRLALGAESRATFSSINVSAKELSINIKSNLPIRDHKVITLRL